jgi:carbamoyltransferase
MSTVYGKFGPAHAWLGKLAYAAALPVCKIRFARHHVHEAESPASRELMESLRVRLTRGETTYLAGLGIAGHNSGAALVEVSARHGVRLLANDEEERFTGVKHCGGYPEHSIESLKQRLSSMGLEPRDLHAVLLSWNYIRLVSLGIQSVAEHFPRSLGLARKDAISVLDFFHTAAAARAAPQRLAQQFGLSAPQPLISMGHHENHAAFSYAVSPFNHSDKPVMITVLDGFGDEGAISLYVAEKGKLQRLRSNESLCDSLGCFYSIISSTQGGWTVLSSEGRYMGAVAWGDGDRLTNPYYRRLRQIFHFGEDGQVRINRMLANWHHSGEHDSYTQLLRDIIGDPIPPEKMWNPDAVLRVEETQHAVPTHERVDLAAATQLVFEDALFHVVDHLIRTTGSDQLVLTGGTALNCLANMHLVDHYDEEWYRRNLGKRTRLHVWVPPTPGDAGVAMGAAYSFALRAGARPGPPLKHAFWCGQPPAAKEIACALETDAEIEYRTLGNIRDPDQQTQIADLMAHVVAEDGVVGLFQGPAEMGPRALGHRSILANPCNPRTLDTINRRVKFREPIRPLAPMATLAAARRFFELSAGGADDHYNAYNYMVLTARATPDACSRIPAVIHRDGTARVQIVREEDDSFTYAFLKAMGRRLGVEVSVNTSLNVGSPIVQTPTQALGALKRAKALSGLVLIADDGRTWFAWPAVATCPEAVKEWTAPRTAAVTA